jgi:hypothetical protein
MICDPIWCLLSFDRQFCYEKRQFLGRIGNHCNYVCTYVILQKFCRLAKNILCTSHPNRGHFYLPRKRCQSNIWACFRLDWIVFVILIEVNIDTYLMYMYDLLSLLVQCCQGDRKGRILVHWVIVYFGQFFLNCRIVLRLRLCIDFSKNWLGYILGDFFFTNSSGHPDCC